MKKKVHYSIFFLASILFVSVSCNKEGETREEYESRNNATIRINLVDAPGDYDEVNVSVSSMTAKYSNGQEHNLPVDSSVHDLLSLSGGMSAKLVERGVLPPGEISYFTFTLGSNNTIVVNGQTYPLYLAGGSGLGRAADRINLNHTVAKGFEYDLTLDFDVEQSVSFQNNKYILNPVIRGSISTETGMAEGSVFPADVPTLVKASNGDIQVSAYTNKTTGLYSLHGLPAGNYTITATPKAGLGYTEKTIENVTVVNGQIASVSSVDFSN